MKPTLERNEMGQMSQIIAAYKQHMGALHFFKAFFSPSKRNSIFQNGIMESAQPTAFH